MKYSFLIASAFIVIACNKKDDDVVVDPIDPADKAKAEALSDFLENDKLHLTKYYSETPIDYIDTDQVVMQETELWQYVSLWLKDDAYTFDPSGNVAVEQNVDRISTDTSAVLTRHYEVFADKDGVGFDFIGHEYQDLPYRLISFSDTNLVVSAQWNGKKVISEYHIVP